MAAPVGRRPRQAGRVLDPCRKLAGKRDGHRRRGAQFRSEQAHFQRHGLCRVADQGVGDRQPFRIKRARERHAEVAVAGAAEVLEAGRQRALQHFDHGATQL
jgi:hypothetical protein